MLQGELQADERRSAAMDIMLAQALPALPRLDELSLQAIQLATAEGAAALASATNVTALSLCDLVFENVTAARRCASSLHALCCFHSTHDFACLCLNLS